MEKKERFVVQVYRLRSEPVTKTFFMQGMAADFAKLEFDKRGVYKVKVWDLKKGEVQPNNPDAPGLIYHFV